MSELQFPSAWLRIDEAAVALGVAETAAVMYAKVDYWRKAVDDGGTVVYAIDDVRTTAKTLRRPAPIIVNTVPPKRDRRFGARPRFLFGRRS